MQNSYIPNIDISSLISSDDFKLDPKYPEIEEEQKYNIDNYEDFLTNSLNKFVEYDRPN